MGGSGPLAGGAGLFWAMPCGMNHPMRLATNRACRFPARSQPGQCFILLIPVTRFPIRIGITPSAKPVLSGFRPNNLARHQITSSPEASRVISVVRGLDAAQPSVGISEWLASVRKVFRFRFRQGER